LGIADCQLPIVSRQFRWAVAAVPPEWRPKITAAWKNRLSYHGQTTPELEWGAINFVRVAEKQTRLTLAPQQTTR